MKHLLIIEDDPAIRMGLERLLQAESYDVVSCSDGEQGLKQALNLSPDVVLLDLNLPSMNGLDVCRNLREKKFSNPIIMLTSRSDQVDKIIGLEMGANDYITKPFDNREILARVRTNLRLSDLLKENQNKYKTEEENEKYKRRLLAVMFTDIQNYSLAMNLNEQAALLMLEVHNKILAQSIIHHRGRIIETVGDSFLASFFTTIDAVSCAVDIQKQLNEHNNNLKDNPGKIFIRIGIHLGDIVEFEGKLKGDALNIAARIQQSAVAGSILLSASVYDSVKQKMPCGFKSLGKFSLKNIREQIELYQVIL